ncbi:MAG: Crp/Fnr family transcriptional regulator [Deltaproteobacteria bacterium]|nr:Crp/Fnr family transcriptional regulator [Deltaproteobacteria bacterium]
MKARPGLDTHEISARAAAHPLLALLEPRVRAAVITASKLVPYRAGRSVLREGDTADRVFALLDGAVRVFHRAGDGSELLVKLFRAPALFGEMEVLVGSCFLEHVATLEASEILQIPAVVFRRLVDGQPSFTRALALDLSARLCIATHNERALGFHDLETRLSNLLLDYAALASRTTEQGTRIEVALTQDGMARDLAVSRRSLIRALERLRGLGLIEKVRGRYLIVDLEGLRTRSALRLGLTYRLSP